MDARYELAKKIVLEAGAFLREHVQDDLVIEEKSGPTDLVTHLDKLVQEHLAFAILEQFPDDLIYGEESDSIPSLSTGNVWVIDPIDGTTNFIAQGTDFAILLAYVEGGVGQFGLIYDVMTDKLYHGGGAYPVYENDRLLPVSATTPIEQGIIGINQGLYAQNPQNIGKLADNMLGMRCTGSAGISFAHVLTQRYRAYVSYIYPWDYMAGMILGEALGYSLITLAGKEPALDGREMVLMVPTDQLERVKGYVTR